MKRGENEVNNEENKKLSRRRYSIIPRETIVGFHKFRLLSIKTKEKVESLYTGDMDEEGILFETDIKLELGTVIQISMKPHGWHGYQRQKPYHEIYQFNKGNSSNLITVIARVVRIEELEEDKAYEVGAQLLNNYKNFLEGL